MCDWVSAMSDRSRGLGLTVLVAMGEKICRGEGHSPHFPKAHFPAFHQS